MSDELQNDIEAPQEQAAQVENQETGAELATDTEGQQEPQAQVDEAAEKAEKARLATQEAFNKQHFQAKQAERERDTLQQKLDEIERKEREAEAVRAGNIPPVPSDLDEDFETKMQARDAAIANQATFNANQAAFAKQQQDQQTFNAQQQAVKDNEMVAAYNAKAVELGISPQELQTVSNTVATYNMPKDLLRHIVKDNDSVLIMKHLAEDPVKAMTLVNMSVYEQGSYLALIRTEAQALRPTQTNTPPPAAVLNGGQAQTDASLYPNSAGAKFS